MKKFLSIIPTLIVINVVVAVLSMIFVTLLKEQQAEITKEKQKLVPEPGQVSREIQQKFSTYEQKIQEKEQTIHNYQAKLNHLETQIREYQEQELSVKPPAQEKNLTTKERETKTDKPSKTLLISQNTLKILKNTDAQVLETRVEPSKTALPVSKPSPLAKLPEKEESLLIPDNKVKYPFQSANKPQNKPQEPLAIAIEVIPPPVTSEGEKSVNQSENKAINPDFNLNNPRDLSIHYANNLAYGLTIATDQGQINHGTKMYRQVQTAILLLRQGETREEAMRKAKVPQRVMTQLMKWGELRPSSFLVTQNGSEENSANK